MRFGILIFLCVGLAACGTVPKIIGPAPGKGPLVYVVVFTKTSTAISERAAAVLNSVAADANRHRWRMVELTGAPLKKPHGAEPNLANARIMAVKRTLAAAGVEEKRIVHGARHRADLDADKSGTQRIEIRLVEKD